MLSKTTFAPKHIKCNITTTLIARRNGDQYLVYVDFSDPTMPSGYREVDYDPGSNDVFEMNLPGNSFNTHGDHEAVAENWLRYWQYHAMQSGFTLAPPDKKALNTIHESIVWEYDDPVFSTNPDL